jgi:methylisocitrate lyase
MDSIRYPGEILRDTLREVGFLELVATPNTELGLQAVQSGSKALHFGASSLRDLIIDAHRLVKTTALPVLVDGSKGISCLPDTVNALESIGAAGLYVQDEQDNKRFSVEAMCARFRQALLARKHASFIVMARCTGLQAEGLETTLARCKAYIAAGVDMIYIDGVSSEGEYRILTRTLQVPLLANMADPAHLSPFSPIQLQEFGVQLVLRPLC